MNKLLLTLALAALAFTSAHAQGTIQFANNAGTRIPYDSMGLGSNIPAAGTFRIAVFAGATVTDALSAVEPAGPLGENIATRGLITAPSPFAYQIAGFGPGQTAFISFRLWQ